MLSDQIAFYGSVLVLVNTLTALGVAGTLKKLFTLSDRVSKMEGYLSAQAESHNPGSGSGSPAFPISQ